MNPIRLCFRPVKLSTRLAALFIALATAALAQTWESTDVGRVGVAGSSTDDRGLITIRGSGADIWGTADGCHFLNLSYSGNLTLAVRVTSPGSGHAWAKVGLMMRQDLTPGAKTVLAYATAGSRAGLQARSATGSTTAVLADSSAAGPFWLMLDRIGDAFRAYKSTDGDNWTKIGEVTVAMTGPIRVGLAVSSHDNAALQVATADNFSLVEATAPTDPVVADANGWNGGDIGAVGSTGTSTLSSDGSTLTLRAGGGDMWGSADALRLHYRQRPGDGMVAARVASLSNTDAWAKAGVMIRSTFDSTSPNAAMVLTPGGNCGFQARTTPGGATTYTAGPRVSLGHWVGVTRAGNVFTGFVSPDGVNWTQVGTAQIQMAADVFFGVAASAHSSTGAQTTAVFDHVSSPVDALPAPSAGSWTQQTWGGVTGDFAESGPNATLSAKGGDIWAASDAGLFAAQARTGDVTITARLAQFSPVHAWTKAGLMIRSSTAANAANAYVAFTGANGRVFQSRTAPGGQTTTTQPSGTSTAGQWLRLVRAGDVFSGYSSVDAGATWTLLGRATIPMSATVQVGLAISSHDAGATAMAEWADVALE